MSNTTPAHAKVPQKIEMRLLTDATRRSLDLVRLRDEIRAMLAGPEGELLGSSKGMKRAPTDGQQEIASFRANLMAVLRDLDARLLKALKTNDLSLNLRYVFLAFLALLFVAAVGYAFFEKNISVGVASVLPAAPAPWLLRNLRSLSDERIWMMLRVKKFETRVVVCESLTCLQTIAKEVTDDLAQLNSPVTADVEPPKRDP